MSDFNTIQSMKEDLLKRDARIAQLESAIRELLKHADSGCHASQYELAIKPLRSLMESKNVSE